MAYYLYSFFVPLIISLAITPLILKYLSACQPKSRMVEGRPCPQKPRLGGMAVFLAFLISVGVSRFAFPKASGFVFGNLRYVLALAGCGAAVFLLGIYDDIKGADAKKKLSVQIPVAVLLYLLGFKITLVTNPLAFLGGSVSVVIPGYISLILTVFWVVGITNALNLIDGMDGLASGVVLFASLALMMASIHMNQFATAVLFLALAGSVAGFLAYNFPPAKITLGDSGSLFLGFAIAALSLKSSSKGAVGLAFVVPITVLGLAILDTLLAIVRRNIQGKSFSTADMDHIHHRVEKLMGCPWKALFVMYGLCFVFCGTALIFLFWGNVPNILAFLLIVGIAGLLSVKLGYIKDAREWLLVKKYGRKMAAAGNSDEFWALSREALKKLGFALTGTEPLESCNALLASPMCANCDQVGTPRILAGNDPNGPDQPLPALKPEINPETEASIPGTTLTLKHNNKKLGKLILTKSWASSSNPEIPPATKEMLEKYMSRGLVRLTTKRYPSSPCARKNFPQTSKKEAVYRA